MPLLWDIFRYLSAAAVCLVLARLIVLSFGYLESLQNSVSGRLYAVRRRWWHKLTGKGGK